MESNGDATQKTDIGRQGQKQVDNYKHIHTDDEHGPRDEIRRQEPRGSKFAS